ncbi:TLD-domain-containing protein [Suhomyces tanzawaensis NRRL Y-17324]|uniref:Oxidation resistance protein 1 n=1 Tax=Suhomyces tanzawaensis NRRL Y-17324 TaxID=984487 RepID=A0A1E4SG95_9ASCO|nr:TLD-domain-containing protein [Suhomyces tanzawaensis NRRL Y-17324]ODV78432.1 TLD-domain-containing protein [Suhomyces tanzawaensis NRRL Y-17324]
MSSPYESKHESLTSLGEEKGENPVKAEAIPARRTSFFGRIMGRRSESPARSSSGSPSRTGSGVSSFRESSLPPLSPLELSGYRPSTKHRLLDSELADNIRNLLPARLQLFDEWELVYSLEQHGISLKTLYRNCNPVYQLEQHRKKKAELGFADSVIKGMVVGSSTRDKSTSRPQGYVMVIRDEKGNKFGCFLNENPKVMDTKRYYGNGECFLWKVEKYFPGKLNHNKEQEKNQEDSTPLHINDKVDTRFKAFTYTGLNPSIIYSNSSFISVGSSGGHNGLWIDQSLYLGVSCVCDTFGNEVLSETDPGAKVGKFKIMGLEVWRVGTLE